MINFLSFLMFIFGLIFLILFIKEKIQCEIKYTDLQGIYCPALLLCTFIICSKDSSTSGRNV